MVWTEGRGAAGNGRGGDDRRRGGGGEIGGGKGTGRPTECPSFITIGLHELPDQAASNFMRHNTWSAEEGNDQVHGLKRGRGRGRAM